MKKISAIIAIVLVLTLVGCGSNDQELTESSKTVLNEDTIAYSVEKSTEPPTEAATEPLTDNTLQTSGPIVIEGSNENFTLYRIDTSSGQEYEVFSFKNTNNFSFSFDLTPDYLPVYLRKQLFNSDMTKLAVNWTNSQDGSKHVGWVDKNGELTDVTNKIHPSSNDFSSKVPNDTNALFSPSGEFFYCDINSEKYCYVNTDTISIVKEEPANENKYGKKIYDVVFHGDIIGDDFSKSGSENSININMGDFKINVEHDKSVIKGYDFAGKNSLIVGVRINQNNSMIGIYGEGINELNNYNAYSVNWTAPVIRQITPDTDFIIEDCAYNNGQIAFTAHRGNIRHLYIINDEDGAEPQLITSLDKKYTLFFWL